MTQEEFGELFEKHDGEFLHFDRVINKRSGRPDVHAFLLLDSLVVGTRDMVSAAAHDEIWLEVEIEHLLPKITEADVIELLRCGVDYDEQTESLRMVK